MENKKMPKVKISEEVAAGTYVNSVVITHSQLEFLIDFMIQMPSMDMPLVKSRIVLTPEHVKRFAEALNANIQSYEKEFGTIRSSSISGLRDIRESRYPDAKGEA